MTSDPKRVLATSARMPFAVDEIRKLGETGHYVVATDTFNESPGLHSRGVAKRHLTPPPTQQPNEFVADVAKLIADEEIDTVLPMFEEVFYLAANREKLEAAHDGVELFFPPLDALKVVNDKVTFADLCRKLDLPVAESATATTQEELKAAAARWEHWFARAAFGRGGIDIATNTGPLAGQTSLDDIHPTEEDPWLVQPFLTGVDRCSWSVVHHGEVVLHSTYEHPLAVDDRGGIVFESVESPESLAAVQKIAKELNWHGQVSFDYLVTEDGVHHMVECNPRPTAGCTVATPEEFDTALFNPGELVVVPPGRKREIRVAVLRDILRHPSRLRKDIDAAKGAKAVYAQKGDAMPLLYSALSLTHVYRYRKALGADTNKELLIASQFFDILYDGSDLGQ